MNSLTLDPEQVESFGQESAPAQRPYRTPYRQLGLNVLFVVALSLTLGQNAWLWVARIGWTLLAILYAVDMRYAVYSIFFFSAWFHPTGFYPALPFTLKHFHLAVFLTLFINIIKNGFLHNLMHGFKRGGVFYPILLMILIGIINLTRFGVAPSALRIPANILLVIFSMIYLGGLKTESKFSLPTAILFFTVGVSMRALMGFHNTLFRSSYFDQFLLHDNHLATLSAFAIFYAIGLFTSATSLGKRCFTLLLSLILFASILASCSRSAWFGFIVGFMVFLVTIYGVRQKGIGWQLSICISLFLVLIVLFAHYSVNVWERISHLPQLLDPDYWALTVNDKRNFGFLGIQRLHQYRFLKDVLTHHGGVGIGFVKEAVDIHGLYFAILASTGIAGFLLFLFSIQLLLRRLIRSIFHPLSLPTGSVFLLRISALAALCVWLAISFMETSFVQFSTWINLLIAAALIPIADPQKNGAHS